MYFLETCSGWTIMSAIGSMIAALVATVYTIITYLLLRKTNQTAERTNTLNEFEIYRQISGVLNTEENRKILALCTNNNLEITYPGESAVNENSVESSDINQILNSMEDLAIFWKKELITIQTINEGLGYKILELGNCQAIVDHILKVREKMPNVFSGFEKLYAAVYIDSMSEERASYRSALFLKKEAKRVTTEPRTPVEAD